MRPPVPEVRERHPVVRLLVDVKPQRAGCGVVEQGPALLDELADGAGPGLAALKGEGFEEEGGHSTAEKGEHDDPVDDVPGVRGADPSEARRRVGVLDKEKGAGVGLEGRYKKMEENRCSG